MDIIELSRQIGKEIQKDERYLNMQLAIQKTDENGELQDLIGQYNLKRIALEGEASKQDRDEEKVGTYQQEMNAVYRRIMENEDMKSYDLAKNELNRLLQRVNAIVMQSANGADPDTADYEESSCSGDCSACGGCH